MQHRVNDTAILAATVSELARSGWNAVKTSEREVEQGRLPVAALYLNMCQGSRAAEQLMPLESDGAVVVNGPSSALTCRSYRFVKRLGSSTLACEGAALLGLEVFVGDVPFPEPDRPVLIDINHWPSFVPFRDEAARAIADYVTHRFAHRKHA